jgi:amidohydrolase
MAIYEELKQKMTARVAKSWKDCVAISDALADKPELSGEEYESSKRWVEYLRSQGFKVEYPFAGLATAFKAVYGADNHSRKIALMAEYDALPGIGHACGHCVSGAVSVLAGIGLAEIQDELDADVHVIGTPNEETDGAKCVMVDQGVFNGYDMAMMAHMYDENMVKFELQCLDCQLYTFHGKAAHAGAAPWEGRNALNGVQLMIHATDMLRQHLLKECQMHCCIRNGGAAPNIVPEEASVEFYGRAMHRDVLIDLMAKMDDCAKGAAIATQTECDKKPTAPCYLNMKPNPTGNACLLESFRELGFDIDPDRQVMFGSSDAGNVSWACPTFHPGLKIAPAGTAVHTREFEACVRTDEAHEVIKNGACLLGLHALKIFTDKERFQAMKDDFAKAK